MDWLHLADLFIALMAALLGSAGFWAYFGKKNASRDVTKRLLIGLAHDRIVYLCLRYIERGSITQDEYENLAVYLFKPYLDFGGNGAVVRLMAEVDKLPIVNYPVATLYSHDSNLKGKEDHAHG